MVFLREKKPLTDQFLILVDQVIDQLKPEVRHANPISIGEDQCYRQPALPTFFPGTPFFGKIIAGGRPLVAHCYISLEDFKRELQEGLRKINSHSGG